MNKLKKLLSVLVLGSFLLGNINSVSALVVSKGIDLETSYFNYGFYSSSEYEKEILKLSFGKALISKVNTLMSKVEKDEKLLDNLEAKLAKSLDKYNYYDLSEKEKQMFLIINYIRAKVKDSKLALKSATYLTNVSESDQKTLDEKLVKLQLSFVDNLEKAIEEATKSVKEYSSYEEKGNFKMDILVDEENLGKFDAKFNINNYQINVSEFDSQVKGHIEAIINAVPKGEKEIKLEIKSFVDFISKDGNYYLLMKDLETKDEAGLYSMFIEPAKTLFKDGKYLKFSDKAYKDALTTLKAIEPKTIFKELKQDFSKPLFKAYKKSGNRYYVVPTKYACDTMKKLANKFDPINGEVCSDSQYNELLADLKDSGFEVYVDLGNTSVFGFTTTKTDQIEKVSGEMTFVDTSLEKVTFSVIPDQKRYPKDGVNFEYLKRKSITLKTIVSDASLNLNILVNLNSDNSFSNANLDLISEFADSKINISNGTISGTTSIKESSKEIFKITTSGKYADKYLKLDNKISFTENLFDMYGNQVLKARNSKRISDISGLQSSVEQIYQDNAEYPTISKFNELVKIYIYRIPEESLKNVEINGCKFGYIYQVSSDKQEYKLSSCMEGEKVLEVGNFLASSKLSEKYYINGYKTWTKKDPEITKPETMSGNFNLEIDVRDNKDNIKMNINGIIGTKKFLEMNISNEGKIEFKNVEIKAPADSQTTDMNKMY